MDVDVKDMTVPTLTFGAETKEMPAVVEETAVAEAQEPAWDDSLLSDEERQMVDNFVGQIDLDNSNAILQYGVGTQKEMADFSETALKNVRTKDLGEVGDLLSGVVTELKSFDAEEEKGFLGFFKKQSNKITAMKAKYDKTEVNVNKICDVLEGHQVQLMKDVAMLDKMYDQNLAYFKELSMYILAGKKKLAQVREQELPQLREQAQRSGQPEDAQAAKDLENKCERFEKKIHDLELTRMISIQTAPQIRLVQNNDTLMVGKIQSTVDSDLAGQHHSAVEEPDGAGFGRGTLQSGRRSSAGSYRYDQRASEEKCRKAENGHHRDCQRVRARHCGYGDAESNQRVPDLHAG